MRRLLPRDTVFWRLTLTVMLAMSASAGLDVAFIDIAGVYANPDLINSGLLEQAATVTRLISAAPASIRPRLAASAGNGTYWVTWLPTAPELPKKSRSERLPDVMRSLLHDPNRRVVAFETSRQPVAIRNDRTFRTAAYGMLIALDDGTWIVFGVPKRDWGIGHWNHNALIIGFVLLATFAIACLAAQTLVRPIAAFADAARRFGADPRALPMIVHGPAELRSAAAAFNAMQTQIRRFVTDRTDMLAAISHDLRTPLTRMRLRGELIDDREQQRRLFRDVDEMQAMIDAALAFFRDDAIQEHSTRFDVSEMVRLVVDDLTDQGKRVVFEGMDHVVYYGRPSALKRAIGNVIENACTYATHATAELDVTRAGPVLSVRDDGPGIPEPLLEAVFQPFYRVDPSRNRQTGGVGLGLTSARTIVRAHGGDITLRNRMDGGLLVTMTLPVATDIAGSSSLAQASGPNRTN